MTRRLLLGFLAPLLLLAGAVVGSPARAADRELNATANGRAEGAAVYIPFHVNPNLDFYPAYSFSEIANSASQSSSHGISAGFYPGFLLDAFMDFYGFKGPGRALLGFAETQWPDPPQKADASTGDFGTLCRESGANPRITQYFPKQLFDGCQQFYAGFTGGFGGSLPYRLSSGHSESDFLSSSGFSDGFTMTLPLGDALTVGHAHSTSATRATTEHATVSDATAVLHDVSFGELHISQIRSSAHATDDADRGPKVARSIEIVGATLAGEAVTIDESGIRPVKDNPQVQAALARFAEEGFVIALVPGEDAVDSDSGEVSTVSGGLQILLVRSGTPKELQAPADQLCRTSTDLQNPEKNGNNPALTPGSIRTIPYDLDAVPPVNDRYQKAWDENYPLGLLLPRDVEGEEPIPPVIPCAGVLFDRSVDAGVVLGVTTASARFIEGLALPDLGDVLTPGIPDRTVTTTTTIPGSGPTQVPGSGTGSGLGQRTTLAAAPPELSADIAQRVKVIYGVLALFPVALLGGRSAFKRLVRT